jgi:hypothetical protein
VGCVKPSGASAPTVLAERKALVSVVRSRQHDVAVRVFDEQDFVAGHQFKLAAHWR